TSVIAVTVERRNAAALCRSISCRVTRRTRSIREETDCLDAIQPERVYSHPLSVDDSWDGALALAGVGDGVEERDGRAAASRAVAGAGRRSVCAGAARARDRARDGGGSRPDGGEGRERAGGATGGWGGGR